MALVALPDLAAAFAEVLGGILNAREEKALCADAEAVEAVLFNHQISNIYLFHRLFVLFLKSTAGQLGRENRLLVAGLCD